MRTNERASANGKRPRWIFLPAHSTSSRCLLLSLFLQRRPSFINITEVPARYLTEPLQQTSRTSRGHLQNVLAFPILILPLPHLSLHSSPIVWPDPSRSKSVGQGQRSIHVARHGADRGQALPVGIDEVDISLCLASPDNTDGSEWPKTIAMLPQVASE